MTAVDGHGLVSTEALRRALHDDTTLISLGYVNNELGTVQSLRDAAVVVAEERQRRLAAGSRRPLFLHTDASQATGMLDISVSRLGVDLMTLNSGKCYGPKAVGLLWVRAGIELRPLIDGGGQENGLRAGTENVAGAIGFATALTLAIEERKSESHRLAQLRDQLAARLCHELPDLTVDGHPRRRAPHILHVSLSGIDGERVVFGLDERGVMAATGSACAASSGTRSHVLTAIGMSDEQADGSLRLSVGRSTTSDDIERAASIIVDVIRHEGVR